MVVEQEDQHMLTTVDNPYNPFTQYDEWFAWDAKAGYHTPSFLARIVKSSNDLSEAQERTALEEAMQEIVRENVNGVYRLATPTFPVSS